jgi:hypothetical protein
LATGRPIDHDRLSEKNCMTLYDMYYDDSLSRSEKKLVLILFLNELMSTVVLAVKQRLCNSMGLVTRRLIGLHHNYRYRSIDYIVGLFYDIGLLAFDKLCSQTRKMAVQRSDLYIML